VNYPVTSKIKLPINIKKAFPWLIKYNPIQKYSKCLKPGIRSGDFDDAFLP
jgi:hypothetical protein